MFQYPLFRIVDCFRVLEVISIVDPDVSISALSDRGLLHPLRCCQLGLSRRFNIRSFGSWIASQQVHGDAVAERMFQYPLFRIVDCFNESN